MKSVRTKGTAAIDRRSSAWREVATWVDEVADALGGHSRLSPQKQLLLEECAITRLLVRHADAYIMESRSLIRRRSRSFYPIIEQRSRLLDGLCKQLAVIGIDRARPEDLASLPADWITRVEPVAVEHEQSKGDDGHDVHEQDDEQQPSSSERGAAAAGDGSRGAASGNDQQPESGEPDIADDGTDSTEREGEQFAEQGQRAESGSAGECKEPRQSQSGDSAE
jgi:hypothetical protein